MSSKQLFDVEYDAAMIQNGDAPRPSFYSDHQQSKAYSIFNDAVSAALKYSGNRLIQETIPKRTSETGYILTTQEYQLLQKRGASISNYSGYPENRINEFLTILCYINDQGDMNKIANATGINELMNSSILRQPMEILSISNLDKLCFLSSAMDGVLNIFDLYKDTGNKVANHGAADDIKSVFDAMSSILGGFGGFSSIAGELVDSVKTGSFLAEILTGKEVPTTVLAKNPIMQGLSYGAQAFFGAHPTPIGASNISNLFAKPIAVFSTISNGNGAFNFVTQNFGSFAKTMSLEQITSKIIFGSTIIRPDSFKQDVVNQAKSFVSDFTGAAIDSAVDMLRADIAQPISMAMSAFFTQTEQTLFSDKSFQEGWKLAQSVGGDLLKSNNKFLDIARKFL